MFWKCQPNWTTYKTEKTIPRCLEHNYKQHMDTCARHPLTNSIFPFLAQFFSLSLHLQPNVTQYFVYYWQ